MSGIQLALLGMSFGQKLPPIGSPYEGGFFAGQISTAGNGIADYNLVVAPKSSGESTGKEWKTSTTTTSGTDSVIDGPTNSANMNNADHPAGEFCEGLTIGSFTDWYLPAKNELEICYYNLKPTTTDNSTSSGANTNAVPSRASTYTNTNPSQTPVTDFQVNNTEAFGPVATATIFYWSSTQSTSTTAWRQRFSDGLQAAVSKTSGYVARAVRRVAV